jgi:uncharacterized protein (TIGR02217 family)
MEVINTYFSRLFGYGLKLKFEWSTDLVNYDTGKEQVNQIWERPKRHWELPYNAIIKAQRDKLFELFGGRAKGMYNAMLFQDPYDYQCSLSECSYTAVGGETTTQLTKEYYGSETEKWTEKMRRIQPSEVFPPIVKIDATVKTEDTHFTLDDDTGIIDWTGGSSPNGALSASEVVTAEFYFYRPVRLDTDIYEETTFWKDLFNMGNIPIVEIIE